MIVLKGPMKTEELKKFIQNLSPDLYSFAYVLIPDDLQASQLMIDCVQSFLIQKKSFIDRMTLSKSKSAQIFLDETKDQIFQIIFELSRKRYQQLKMSFSDVEQGGGFFSLEFDEKAILYLKERSNFKLTQIEMITGNTQAEVLAYLFSARVKMSELIPNQIAYDEVQIGGVS